jgi:hypothetical protein
MSPSELAMTLRRGARHLASIRKKIRIAILVQRS